MRLRKQASVNYAEMADEEFERTLNGSSKRKRKFEEPEKAVKKKKKPTLLPPDLPSMKCDNPFERTLPSEFWCPKRLHNTNPAIIHSANDWHFAMLNDTDRNSFFERCLKRADLQGKVVLDIGSGTGILSMLAAKMGAKTVYACEASEDMARMCQTNVKRNGLHDVVQIHNVMSTEFEPSEEHKKKIDVVVSETLGTLLLGESQLDYMIDASRRLTSKKFVPIPYGGAQFVSLIECPEILEVARSQDKIEDLDMSNMNSLRDTARMNYTKNLGFQLSSKSYKTLVDKIKLFQVTFDGKTTFQRVPHKKHYNVVVKEDGVVTAAICSWEVWGDKERTIKMTTHPEDTIGKDWGFARDMQWGQGIQFVEDTSNPSNPPKLLRVTKGQKLSLRLKMSADRRHMQILVSTM